ncbi:MAG: hypothetical protein ACYTGV_03890 [Planctomycetota bacterium]|jgi:hypothetical protein
MGTVYLAEVAEASVRRAAVIALLAARRPLSPEQREAVHALRGDPDGSIPPLAKQLLKRQPAADG